MNNAMLKKRSYGFMLTFIGFKGSELLLAQF
jgi:hypothetical protein